MSKQGYESIHDNFQLREELIFRSALSEFCAKGYDGASISSIAAAVGISEALIYKHVAGKKELLYRSIALGYEHELSCVLLEIEAGHHAAPSSERLKKFVRAHVGAWSHNPRFHLLYFHESRKPKSEYSHILSQKGRMYFHLLQEILQEGIHSGEFHEDLDTIIARDFVIGGIDQTVWWRAEKGLPIEVDAISGKISAMLLRSFVKPDYPSIEQ